MDENLRTMAVRKIKTAGTEKEMVRAMNFSYGACESGDKTSFEDMKPFLQHMLGVDVENPDIIKSPLGSSHVRWGCALFFLLKDGNMSEDVKQEIITKVEVLIEITPNALAKVFRESETCLPHIFRPDNVVGDRYPRIG